MRRILSGSIYVLSAIIGILAFINPFITPVFLHGPAGMFEPQNVPLLTTTLIGLSVVALVVEVQDTMLSAKTIALMGLLVAVTSVLRFVEVALPLPGGFSPIFVPIIISGYVFGARFGYLMGVLTLLVSALITGGVGPWLPYQMFAAGWSGAAAGWLPHTKKRLEIALLCMFGFLWGVLYGIIINLYFWPLIQGSPAQTYVEGLGFWDIISRYASFYTVTSLWWDLIRGVGNVAMLLLLAAPMLKILYRFQKRFNFEVAHD
ncbi:MAG: ECF transporter S component, partial [Anaerolineae bacterium]|nr:ECF transporter S component [Anaerolineae bacterium]